MYNCTDKEKLFDAAEREAPVGARPPSAPSVCPSPSLHPGSILPPPRKPICNHYSGVMLGDEVRARPWLGGRVLEPAWPCRREEGRPLSAHGP